MNLPINDNFNIFTVPYFEASMYQLFLSIKGIETVAEKSLDGIGTAMTCMLVAGNTF